MKIRRFWGWISSRIRGDSVERSDSNLRRGRAFLLEELEPRTLYSADPLLGAVGSESLVELQDPAANYVDSVIVDSGRSQPLPSDQRLMPPQISSIPAEGDGSFELVIVDTGVDGYEQLVFDLKAQTDETREIEIYLLDGQRDGVEQISEILSSKSGLNSIHIVSHGSDGNVTLGNSVLNSETLETYTEAIGNWSIPLDADADILFYGCDLAASVQGQSLISKLGSITSADFAASDDSTGHASLGGDWELEYAVGTIETQTAFSADAQENWHGLLGYETYRDEFNAYNFDNSEGSQDWSTNPWQEIGEGNGAGVGQVAVWNSLGEQGLQIWQDGHGAMRQVDLSSAASAMLDFDYARIGLDDVSDFIALEISANGGGSWVELDRFSGPADDSNLQHATYDITGYAASDTQIRFMSSGLTSSDSLFVDNFQVSYASSISTVSEFLVNQTTAGTQETSAEGRGSQQAVSMAADGSYVITWSSANQDGSGWGIYARRFDAMGAAISGEILVNQTTGDDQVWARVASDAAGNFVVTWTSANQDGTPQSVYARRFDSSGTALAGEFRINDTASGTQKNSSISMNSTGEFVIIWQGNGPGDADGIFARRFDSNGVAQGTTEFQVNQTNYGLEENASVDMKSNGDFVVTWNYGGEVYARMFDSDNIATTGDIRIDISSVAYRPDIAYHESGKFTVTWRSDSILPGVYTRRFDDNGNAITSVSLVSFGTGTDPSISTDQFGNYIVTWQQMNDGYEVYARKYDANGSSVGGQFFVSTTTVSDQHMASVSAIDLNNFVVVWSGNGVTDTDGVFARQFGSVIINNPPTFTAFSNPIEITNEDIEIEVTFAELAAQGNQADSDGTVTAFIVKAISSGMLRIGADSVSASAWAAGSNDTIDSNHHAYWTPGPGANGILGAFEVVAQDDQGLQSSAIVTADINVIANATPTTAGIADVTVNEDAADTVIDLFAAFADAEDADANLTYTVQNNSNAGLFTSTLIDGVAGTLTLDYAADRNGSAAITVRATDTGGVFVETTFNVTLNAVNDAPSFTTLGDQTVAENSGAQTVAGFASPSAGGGADESGQTFSYTVSNDNPALFSVAPGIDAGGQLTYTLAAGQSGTATVTVSVTDSGGTAHSGVETSANQTFDINVTANATPTTAGIADVTVNEDAADTVIDLFAAFADAEDADANLTYTVQNNSNAGLFTSTLIDGVAGTLTLDYAADRNGSAAITVRATDTGGVFVETTFNVTLNAVNDSPIDIALTNSTVSENIDTSAGFNVGKLSSVDPDVGDLAAYTIVGGTDQAKFTIGGADNDELILSDGILDHEIQSLYNVRVEVQDSGGLIYQEDLNINVSDQNEIPVVISNSVVSVNEKSNTVINIIATDQDLPAQTLSYTVSGGADAGMFSVGASTGALVFDFAPDFENPADLGQDNVYQVVVTVDDGNGGSAVQNLTVTVLDENEAPQFLDSVVQLNKASGLGTVLGNAKAVDQDVGDNLSYSLLSDTSGGALSLNVNGDLVVTDDALLNSQPSDVFTITLQVTDNSGLTDTAVITVQLDSNNAAPAASNQESVAQSKPDILGPVSFPEFLSTASDVTDSGDAEVPEQPEDEAPDEPLSEEPLMSSNVSNYAGNSSEGNKTSVANSNQVNTEYGQYDKDISGTRYIRADQNQLNSLSLKDVEVFGLVDTENEQQITQDQKFIRQLDRLRQDVQEETELKKAIAGSSVAVTTGLSVGYVIWLVRGGVLVSSVLSSLPAWRMIDPLPILGTTAGRPDDELSEKDSLDSLIRKGSALAKIKVEMAKNRLSQNVKNNEPVTKSE